MSPESRILDGREVRWMLVGLRRGLQFRFGGPESRILNPVFSNARKLPRRRNSRQSVRLAPDAAPARILAPVLAHDAVCPGSHPPVRDFASRAALSVKGRGGPLSRPDGACGAPEIPFELSQSQPVGGHNPNRADSFPPR